MSEKKTLQEFIKEAPLIASGVVLSLTATVREENANAQKKDNLNARKNRLELTKSRVNGKSIAVLIQNKGRLNRL